MIPGILASQRPVTVVAPGSGAFLVGETGTSESFSGSPTLSVPAGTQIGDTLVAILRCRGDRSFTIPTGWTSRIDIYIGTYDNTRLYVATKVYSGDATETFTQSTSAACAASLMAVRGSFIAIDHGGGPKISLTANASDFLIAVGTSNQFEPSASITWTNPFVAVNRYAFLSGPYFYFGLATASCQVVASGTLNCTYSWTPFNIESNYSCVMTFR